MGRLSSLLATQICGTPPAPAPLPSAPGAGLQARGSVTGARRIPHHDLARGTVMGIERASVTLPLRYLLTAAGAFLLAALSIPLLADELAGFYYRPALAALAHIVTLGGALLFVATLVGIVEHLGAVRAAGRRIFPRLAAGRPRGRGGGGST